MIINSNVVQQQSDKKILSFSNSSAKSIKSNISGVSVENKCFSLLDSNSNSLIPNVANSNFYREVVKFKVSSYLSADAYFTGTMKSSEPNELPMFLFSYNWGNQLGMAISNNGSWTWVSLNIKPDLNTWYYIVAYCIVGSGQFICSLYDESGNHIKTNYNKNITFVSNTYVATIGGTNVTTIKNFEIDLNESFIEVNGEIIWGKKNSKTENMGIMDFTDFSQFTATDYIESTGTQYISTGYNVKNKDFKVEFEIQSNIDYNPIFSYNTLNNLGHYFQQGTTKLSTWLNDSMNCTVEPVDLTQFTKVEFQRVGDVYTNTCGNLFNTYTYTLKNQTTEPVEIFRRRDSGSIQWGKFKLKYFKLYDNGTLVRNFVSCYHSLTNMIGLFDLVNNVFYRNSGTGEFNIGNVV